VLSPEWKHTYGGGFYRSGQGTMDAAARKKFWARNEGSDYQL
jgi:hypothetical protein